MPNLPNMKNKKIILIVLISLSFFGSFVYFSRIISKNSPPPSSLGPLAQTRPLIKGEEKSYLGKTSAVIANTQIVKPIKEKVKENENGTEKNFQSVTILAGDATAYLQVSPNTIFYDALMQAKNSGMIMFSGKNYTGLGFFVTEIGTLRAGGGKNLLYYVNGKEATVGVSSYTLKDGDVIEWKLE